MRREVRAKSIVSPSSQVTSSTICFEQEVSCPAHSRCRTFSRSARNRLCCRAVISR